jgi:peptide methionine sulfoxide reductase MsrB
VHLRWQYNTKCGWPSFFDNVPDALTRVQTRPPKGVGHIGLTEIVCTACNGHIGHIFKGASHPGPWHERHCVNGACLKFVPPEEAPRGSQPNTERALATGNSRAIVDTEILTDWELSA